LRFRSVFSDSTFRRNMLDNIQSMSYSSGKGFQDLEKVYYDGNKIEEWHECLDVVFFTRLIELSSEKVGGSHVFKFLLF